MKTLLAVQQSTVVQPAVSGQTQLLSLLPLTPADLHQASTDYLQPDRELTGHQQKYHLKTLLS